MVKAESQSLTMFTVYPSSEGGVDSKDNCLVEFEKGNRVRENVIKSHINFHDLKTVEFDVSVTIYVISYCSLCGLR